MILQFQSTHPWGVRLQILLYIFVFNGANLPAILCELTIRTYIILAYL